jgi:hypothetical protein
MPVRKIHLRASRKLLGYSNPLVHDILDTHLPIEEHRRTHNPRTIRLIGELLGEDAEREAWLHFLLDYGLCKID